MLVFGPFRAIPPDEPFIVYNLSSPVDSIPRLPGLLVPPPAKTGSSDADVYNERTFDGWYYDYLLNDPTACASVMQILLALYNGNNVYVCIADYSEGFINIINEVFMKFLQVRYGIKYSIINNKNDFIYIPKDGCDFSSVDGIRTFDEDHRRYLLLATEQNISIGLQQPQ